MTQPLTRLATFKFVLGALIGLQLMASALAQAPASLAATWKINGNGFAGDLVLTQAADGRLSGTVYGQPVEGYYSPGAGTVVFMRYQANKPYQVFVGTASPQGLRGDFYPFAPDGGATPARLRYDWSATLAPAFVGAAPRKSAVALLPPMPAPATPAAPSTPAAPAAPTPAAPTAPSVERLSGFVTAVGPPVNVAALSSAEALATCPGTNKVAIHVGYRTSPINTDARHGIEVKAAMPLGATGRVAVRNANVGVGIVVEAIVSCINATSVIYGHGNTYSATSITNVDGLTMDCGNDRIIGGGFSSEEMAQPISNLPVRKSNGQSGYMSQALKTTPLPGRFSTSVTRICVPASALPDWEIVSRAHQQIGPRSSATLSLDCPAGKRMLSSGFLSSNSVGFIPNTLEPKSTRNAAGFDVVSGGVSAFVSNRETLVGSVNVGLGAVCATVP